MTDRVYEKILTVSQNDLDALRHVNNVRYVTWIQQVSEAHWQHASHRKFDGDYVWVVRKHEITYHSAAKESDILVLTTHVERFAGAISKRFVEIKNNKTQQIVVTAITDWCLLDAKTLKPRRIPAQIENLFFSDGKNPEV